MAHSSGQTAGLELMEGAPIAVVRVDAGGEVLAWNAAAGRMFGVQQGDAVGRSIGALVPVAGGEATWRELIAAAAPARRDWETRVAGRTVRCAWTVHPLAGGGAALYGQQLAEPTAEAKQQKVRDLLLRAMLDTLDLLVWVTDKDGVCTLFDGKAMARTGIKLEHVLGVNVVEMFGAKYPALLEGLQGTPVHFFTQEGAGHFENWAIPMRDEHGQQIALVAFTLDITEARRREQELQTKLDVIGRQQRAMREMSTPIIEVWDQVICLPLVGLVDTARTADIMDSLLQAVTRTRARFAILDLTGVDVLDTATANHLLGMTRALRLLGAQAVLTGIHPHVAQTVVTLGVDLTTLTVRANLREALKSVLAALGSR